MLYHVVETPEPLDADLLRTVRSDVVRQRAICERVVKRASYRLFSAKVRGASGAELDQLAQALDDAQVDLSAATFDVDRYLHPTRIW